MKKALEDAKFNDLMAYAKAQQLEIRRGIDTAGLIELIRTGLPDVDAIDVADAPEPEVKTVDGGLTDHYRDDPRVRINIMSNELTGKHPMALSVNGDHIVVRPDTDVTIPYRFYEVLLNAVEDQRTQSYDAANMKFGEIVTPRRTMNFSVLSGPSEAEVAAWRARTADIGRGDDAMISYRKLQAVTGLLSQAA